MRSTSLSRTGLLNNSSKDKQSASNGSLKEEVQTTKAAMMSAYLRDMM
jgi:hypothetical protein